jgi:hypothetical protein
VRKDHYSPPSKWAREWNQALQLSGAHLRVYQYCENGMETHRTGIYLLTPSAIAEWVGSPAEPIEREDVERILDDLERVGLLHWDRNNRVIWVPCVCGEQFRWKGEPKANDYRVQEAREHIIRLPTSPLVTAFLDRWPVFKAPPEGAYQGATQAPPEGTTTYSLSPSYIFPRGKNHSQKSEIGGAR